MKYLIGIDGGSQSTKVIVFDQDGRVAAAGREPLKPLRLPREGVAEHPDDDLWDSLRAACRQALAAFPGRLSDLAGVGLCTIRCCRVLLKEDLSLAQPVISWMDLRLARPYEHDNPDVRYVTTTTGYIGARLTGRRLDTAANLLGQWPLDPLTWNWSEDPDFFGRFNLPRAMLFDLIKPGELAGRVTKQAAEATGLPEGLPVAATASDKAVEALGAGPLGPGAALLSLGTYICSMVEGLDGLSEGPRHFTNLASRPGRYLYESDGIRRGMSTISWVRELMGGDVERQAAAEGLTPDDWLNRRAALIPPGAEGLMTVPEWLAPPSALHKRGLMIGFTGRHGGAHMYRSVMEAVALTMAGHCRAMCRELNFPLERLTVSGGGSKGDLFMQIVADAFGLPAGRAEINDAVALGSAICAAVGVGLHAGFDEAVAAMVRPADVFQPDPAVSAFYRRLYDEVYSGITSVTDEILKKAYPLFN
ncbi:MAG: sugar kinase [Deltaproteobacteria bacterium]|jgi:sugar (pentulose or hexulose) kinase|nr:sugar kinase [Deltaproteobacteria bacterium]